MGKSVKKLEIGPSLNGWPGTKTDSREIKRIAHGYPGQPVAIFGYPNGAICPDRRYVQDSPDLAWLVRKSEET